MVLDRTRSSTVVSGEHALVGTQAAYHQDVPANALFAATPQNFFRYTSPRSRGSRKCPTTEQIPFLIYHRFIRR